MQQRNRYIMSLMIRIIDFKRSVENMVNIREQDFQDKDIAEKEIGMYLSFCISTKERDKLKEVWNEHGGHKVIPWYKWVLQNVSVNLDL